MRWTLSMALLSAFTILLCMAVGAAQEGAHVAEVAGLSVVATLCLVGSYGHWMDAAKGVS